MKWKLKTGADNNHRTKWPKSLYVLLYQEGQQLQRLVSLLILVRNVPQWTQLFIHYNSLRQIKCPYLGLTLEYYFEAFEPNWCSFNLLCQAQTKKAKGATRKMKPFVCWGSLSITYLSGMDGTFINKSSASPRAQTVPFFFSIFSFITMR